MTNERRKQIRKRRRKKEKNGFAKWFKGLKNTEKAALIIGALVLVLVLVVAGYVFWAFSKLETEDIKEEDIIINEFEDETVGEGYTNFVLFGGDSRNGDVKKDLNTDTIIIVSLNNETREVKMVSVYRDTLLDVSKNSIQKCNSAYSRGGATQAINMLNRNLDLNIQKFVTVDFGAVTDVVDMIGGIEIDVSEKEWKEVNKYIGETAQVAGKKAIPLTHSGLQTLDGVQATTYARIRKNVGDDYARTARQRLVIEKVVEKAMKSDLATLTKIIDKVFPKVYTNLSMTEIMSYAKDFKKYKMGENTGFPFDKGSGTIPGRGSSVYAITLAKNVTKLHEFLYGTEEYQPSATVASISNTIAEIVGNRKVEPNTTWTDDGKDTSKSDDENDANNPDVDNGSDTNEGNEGDGNGNNTGSGDNTGNGGDNTGNGGDSSGNGGDNSGSGDDNSGSGGDNSGSGGDNSGSSDDNSGSGGDNTGSGEPAV